MNTRRVQVPEHWEDTNVYRAVGDWDVNLHDFFLDLAVVNRSEFGRVARNLQTSSKIEAFICRQLS